MTVFFSDRPERVTGQVRNDLFTKLWRDGRNSFKNDPPNAALTVFDPQGQPAQAVVTLSNPRLDGRDIQYDARVLTGAIPPRGAESTLRLFLGQTVKRSSRGIGILPPFSDAHLC